MEKLLTTSQTLLIIFISNEHVSTVGERLVSNATPLGSVDDNIHLTHINSLEGKCTLPDITEEYVQKEMSSMSVEKATGPDGIGPKCKHFANSIEVYMAKVHEIGTSRV